MDDYSERKKLEKSVTACRIGKVYVNDYADRFRVPTALFNVEIYLLHQYGIIVTEELG